MSQKPRILLIDDSETLLEALRIYLLPRFDVVTACQWARSFEDI